MINIKNKLSIQKMTHAGGLLAFLFKELELFLRPGITTLDIDTFIAQYLRKNDLVSQTKGYMGYQHVCCTSLNDEVVHGVPSDKVVIKDSDLVKIDVCAAWKGYCADMARTFVVGNAQAPQKRRLALVAQQALDAGIQHARAGNFLSDISSAIQKEVEKHGFGVVRDFAGHGIGKKMHEDPEILNYGPAGKGPILRPGMTFAIEPMITAGSYEVYITDDEWTVKTADKSLAAHVEDTILITNDDPKILTRSGNNVQKSNK